MRYKLLVFDFDGTLADSFPFFLEQFDTLADAHGFRRIDRRELDTLRGLEPRQLMKHVGLPMWKMPRVGLHFMSLMAQNIGRIGLFDGIGPVLRQLSQQGVKLAVVTSNSQENVQAVLGPDTASLIAYYECGASLFGKRSKLRRLLAESGVARRDVLCIGDEVRDIVAAHGEKLDFAAVAWGYNRLETLLAHSPEIVFSKVEEIPEKLVQHQNFESL